MNSPFPRTRSIPALMETRLRSLMPELQASLAGLQGSSAALAAEISGLAAQVEAQKRLSGQQEALLAVAQNDIAAVQEALLAVAQNDIAAVRSSTSMLREEVDSLRARLEAQQNILLLYETVLVDIQKNLAGLPAVRERVESLYLQQAGLAAHFEGDFYDRHPPKNMEGYWSEHNVSCHRTFRDAQDSVSYLEYRNQLYPGYIELMPYNDQAGKVVLDYGCGPGNDLVGFATHGKPSRLIGLDISKTSLEEAKARLALHHCEAELIHVPYGTRTIPLPDHSVDYVHCSGVLMLIEKPEETLAELRRILRSGGEIRCMVYNYDSLWVHLYVAYFLQIRNGLYGIRTVREAFSRTTDGEYCPLVHVWDRHEMKSLAEKAGLSSEFLGAAMSLWELNLLSRRFEALMDERLSAESRSFLLDLTLDQHGHPCYRGHRAGIDGCYRLKPMRGRRST